MLLSKFLSESTRFYIEVFIDGKAKKYFSRRVDVKFKVKARFTEFAECTVIFDKLVIDHPGETFRITQEKIKLYHVNPD